MHQGLLMERSRRKAKAQGEDPDQAAPTPMLSLPEHFLQVARNE